jgi:hypothetical protein
VPHIPDFLWSFVGSLNFMRLSLKESRTKLPDATNLDRKSGIRGPKTMGEAHQSLSFVL